MVALRRSAAPLLLVLMASMGACSAAGPQDPAGSAGAIPPKVTGATTPAPTAVPDTNAAVAPATPAASGAASASPSPGPAAPTSPRGRTAAQIQAATLASSSAFEIVRSLTDEAGARLAGTPGNDAAVAWALRVLPTYGLENVHAERVMVPRWERGAESGEILAPHRHRIALTALGGSVATPRGGLTAEVIEVASLDALSALDKAAVAGKIVFISTRMERTRDGSGYGRAARMRVAGPSLAAKLGAVGLVIRSVGTDGNRLPHTGVLVYDKAQPQIPAAALAVPDAELLQRLLQAGKPVRLRMALGGKSLPEVASANVIGEVRGAGAPEEVVLLGAHLDSWDVGTGALDDGAGCAVVIEAARQIAKLARRPRRTVRVVLFNNEENGGAGANGYAKDHAAELGRHTVAVEADLGAGRVWGTRFLGAPETRPAFLSVAEMLKPLGVEAVVDDARGGSDIGPLRAAGVPIIDLAQDASLYFDIHHTENDTLDKIRKEELDQVAAAYATLAFAVADMEGDFGRIPEGLRVRR